PPATPPVATPGPDRRATAAPRRGRARTGTAAPPAPDSASTRSPFLPRRETRGSATPPPRPSRPGDASREHDVAPDPSQVGALSPATVVADPERVTDRVEQPGLARDDAGSVAHVPRASADACRLARHCPHRGREDTPRSSAATHASVGHGDGRPGPTAERRVRGTRRRSLPASSSEVAVTRVRTRDSIAASTLSRLRPGAPRRYQSSMPRSAAALAASVP